MVGKKTKATRVGAAGNNTNDVDEFMAGLEHPLRAEIEAVRRIILGADKRITEGIKWKAPSFYFKDYFATFNLRATENVQVILHKGAKVKDSTAGFRISDPSGLLKWLAKERCVATLSDLKDIKSRKTAFVAIVKQWVKQM